MCEPGAVVIWWDGHKPRFGVVAGLEKQRVRLIIERGKEQRIKSSRIALTVEPEGELPGATPESRRRAGERIVQVADRLNGRATDTTETAIPLLWNVVEDDGTAAFEPRSLDALAREFFSEAGPEDRAVLLLSLVADGIHFFRRGEGWIPRPRSSVVDLIAERKRIAEQERQTEAFFEALARTVAGETFEPSGDGVEKRYLDALEELAVRDDEATGAARDLALRALHASAQPFERPHEGAFRILRRVGRFGSDDENLQIRRFELQTHFDRDLLDRATSAASREFDRSGRRDLTGLESFSIDGPHTVEIDDLISIESAPSGALRLGIHIADPTPYVVPDDPLDAEAASRGLTYYLPQSRLPMLPPAISEDAASLVEGQDRPALSFLLQIDASGGVSASEIVPSVVRSGARLGYAAADATVRAGVGEWARELELLATWAIQRRQARLDAGAVMLLTDEVGVVVDAEGRTDLDRSPKDSASRIAVMEAMILCGELAARFGIDAGLPLIFRRQSIAKVEELPPQPISDPGLVRSARRLLKRAELGLEPGPHESLGLAAYAQVSSPIRRFQDLANLRQILATLRGERAPYDREAMQRILATTERAELTARRAERASRDYWLLKYLESRTGQEVGAQVIDLHPRPTILLDETLLEHPLPRLVSPSVGQRVRLRIERVNPRAGLLNLSISTVLD